MTRPRSGLLAAAFSLGAAGLCLSAGLCLAACASGGARAIDAEQRPADAVARPAEAATRAGEPAPATALALERAAPPAKRPLPEDPRRCEAVARAQLVAGDADGALAMLARCSELEAFFDPRPLMKAPWLGELRRRTDEATRILARIVARGGDSMAVDLALLRDAGFDLWPLKGAEQHPDAYRHRYVIVRGRLERPESGAAHELVVRELIPRRNTEVYLSYGRYVAHSYAPGWSFQPSGRVISAVGDLGACRMGQKELQVMLVRIDAVEPVEADLSSPDLRQDVVFRAHGRLIECRPDRVTRTEGRDADGFR